MKVFQSDESVAYEGEESYAIISINTSLDPNVCFVNVTYCIGAEQVRTEQFTVNSNLEAGLNEIVERLDKLPQWRYAVFNEETGQWE